MGAEIRRDDDQAARAVGERLAAIYRDIGQRTMRELSVYNEALAVEPIGFGAHDGRALGILVTPWFMNVVSVPLGRQGDGAPPVGATVRHVLPSGAYDFIIGDLDGFGRIETSSLFSPMFDFHDAETARAAAHAALVALLDPPRETAPGSDGAAGAPASISRRRILHGKLRGPRP